MDAITGNPGRAFSPPTLTQAVTAAAQAAAVTPSAAPTAAVGSPAAGDTVEVSGWSIMVSRIFRAVPESVAYTPGNGPAVGSIYNYLTTDDRKTIASLYDDARTNGIDPRQIDLVAADLASYRSEPPEVWGPPIDVVYDENYNARPACSYSDSEEAAAKRILTSKAIKDCALPEEFLRFELNGGGHAADFNVLEKIVYATSKSGSDGATDPNAVLAPRPRERFAAALAAGEILTPEQAGRTFDPDGRDSFDTYAHRVQAVVPLLSEDEKTTLGSLYAATANKYGPESRQMKSIDRLARALASLRLAGLAEAGSRGATIGQGTSMTNLFELQKTFVS